MTRFGANVVHEFTGDIVPIVDHKYLPATSRGGARTIRDLGVWPPDRASDERIVA